MKKYDAVIAGYTCVDMIPNFSKESNDLAKIFVPGKLTEIEGMSFTLGGIVPNTGLAMKKFGMNIFLNGLVGEDYLGKLVWDWLDKFHLALGLQSTTKSGTAFSIVLAPHGLDRIFLESPGCNQIFQPDHLNLEAIAQSRLFHFGYPPLLKQFYINDGALLSNLFSRIQNMGIVTSLDFCLPDSSSESGKVSWPQIMERVLPFVDIFVPGLEELLKIMEPEEYHEFENAYGEGDILDKIPLNKIREIGRKVIQKGVKILLIKAGHRGAYLITGEPSGIRSLKLVSKKWNHCEIWCDAYKCEPDKVINSSGAGDTAAAAFLTAILKGEDPEMALKYAALAGRNNLYCSNINDLDNWKEMSEEIKYNENELIWLNNKTHEIY
jgi:sugar/nucleoside kinase (ribokinase family)